MKAYREPAIRSSVDDKHRRRHVQYLAFMERDGVARSRWPEAIGAYPSECRPLHNPQKARAFLALSSRISHGIFLLGGGPQRRFHVHQLQFSHRSRSM